MRRSRLEVYLKVLELLYEGESRLTHLMYGANTSRTMVVSLLDSLIGQRLVTVESDKETRRDKRTSRYYYITEKGVETLRYFKSGDELMSILSA